MPTRCNRWFLSQILLLAQHVSGTIMPNIRSSRELYKWLLPVVLGALVFKLSVWCGVEGYVSGLWAAAPLLSVEWINSWWWTNELSETCRVSWQNKFVKFMHLVGFIIKKILLHVSMHLHHLRAILSFCFAVLIIPAYRKHQHRDYTCDTVQTVHTATKLTTFVYCNYSS